MKSNKMIQIYSDILPIKRVISVRQEAESKQRIGALQHELNGAHNRNPVKEKVEMRYHDGNIFMEEERILGSVETPSASRARDENNQNDVMEKRRSPHPFQHQTPKPAKSNDRLFL